MNQSDDYLDKVRHIKNEIDYLIDEKKGRTVAEQKKITFFTTADVLLLLLKEKVIDFQYYQQNLSRYAKDGWLSANIYQKYMTEGKKYE